MSKNLIVCDLDDTLLNKKKEISKKSIKFIRKIVQKGNYFVICTGRPISSAINFYEVINLDMPVISDNGALITFPKQDKKIEFAINLDTFKKLLTKSNEYIVTAFCNSKEKLFVQNIKDVPKWLMHHLPETKIIEGHLLDNIDINPLLPNIWIKEGYHEKFIEILDEFKEEIDYRYWGFYAGRHSFELFSTKASKGLAMNYLKDMLGCTKTISFGDQLNDLSMIEMADIGVAMINSVEKLKDKAKYITKKDYNHNGVIHYLKKNKLY